MVDTPSDEAYEAFDYIINTKRTYDMLGEALRMLERRAKRYRLEPEEELKRQLSFNLVGGARWTGWAELLNRTMERARDDFLKDFPEEAADLDHPLWLGSAAESWSSFGVSPAEVLRIALIHRDRFSGRA